MVETSVIRVMTDTMFDYVKRCNIRNVGVTTLEFGHGDMERRVIWVCRGSYIMDNIVAYVNTYPQSLLSKCAWFMDITKDNEIIIITHPDRFNVLEVLLILGLIYKKKFHDAWCDNYTIAELTRNIDLYTDHVLRHDSVITVTRNPHGVYIVWLSTEKINTDAYNTTTMGDVKCIWYMDLVNTYTLVIITKTTKNKNAVLKILKKYDKKISKKMNGLYYIFI
jgi:hypothetical protein